MRQILKMVNIINNMEVKWEIEKKNYAMTKSKSAVQITKDKGLNQQNENKKQVKYVDIIEFSSKRGQKTTYRMALMLEKKSVGRVVFEEGRQVKQNDLVIGRECLLDIKISEEVKGEIIKKNYTMIKSKSAVQFMRACAFIDSNLILWEKLLCEKL